MSTKARRYSSKNVLFIDLNKYKYDWGDSKTYIKKPLGSYTHSHNISYNGVVWNQSLRSNYICSIFWDLFYVQVHALKWKDHFDVVKNVNLHNNVKIFFQNSGYISNLKHACGKQNLICDRLTIFVVVVVALPEKLTLCFITNHISSLNRMYSIIEGFIT